jgi:hypothetical protein
MLKNTASQKVLIFAYDTAANAPKTGNAASITAFISKDGVAPVQSNDVNPAELDASNMPGVYVFDLTLAETNCNSFTIYAKSVTADIQIDPVRIETAPASPAVAGEAATAVIGLATENNVTAVGNAVAALNDIAAADVKTAIEAAGSHLALIKTAADWLKAVKEGDSYIDISDPTQYQIVVHKKGDPATEYIRKDWKDSAGAPVTGETKAVYSETEPT